jgi:hypothetical protein
MPVAATPCSSATSSSSSSRIGSSGADQAKPADSRVLRSSSSRTPVSWLTWRYVRDERAAYRWYR